MLRPGGINLYTVRNTADVHFGQGIHHGENMYEIDGFIVHFFDEAKIKHLAQGFEIKEVTTFEEGDLPRTLFLVYLKKQ
ncbi:hypothetical protein [Thermosinus carboxydivorans]|uniref:hypothetical protein n=1 Tax=Thermosinus carboxydivorans TaxID=261685 RepID=UPI0002F69BB4|nr:hypothetical protein [Thermosinus carboxydivorans]